MPLDDKPSVLVSQAIEIFVKWGIAKKRSSETLRGYRIDMMQFNRYLTRKTNCPVFVDEIGVKEVEEFLEEMTEGRTAATLNRKINILSSFFKCMKSKKIVDENIMENFERLKNTEKERTFLTKEEIDSIINSVKHKVLKYFLTTMVYTGLRVKECRNLTLEDVDFESKTISVIEGKGGKNRTVPMNGKLASELQTYLEYYRPETDSLYFFALPKTGTVSTQYVNKALKEATEAAGITKTVTSHILRHSFASLLVKSGANIAVVSKLLGHSDLKTTSVYVHAHNDDLTEAVNKLVI
jgi:integrase/recombinase XerD